MRANTVVAERTGKALALNPRLLSLRETIVLADIMEREKDIRNDISRGVVPMSVVVRFEDAHMCFNWPFVVTFAAVYGNRLLSESRELRRVAFEKVYNVAAGIHNPWAERCTAFIAGPELHSKHSDWHSMLAYADLACAEVDIDNYLNINIGKACDDVKPRVNLYASGLARVEENHPILGGGAVFKDTRISVVHIGKMADKLAARGDSFDEIYEDYSLTEGDVEFARLYYRARPPVGRPRSSGVINGSTVEP